MDAIFTGSFDPFTLGHLDLLMRAIELFDHIDVLVADNKSKVRMFDAVEMAKVIRDNITPILSQHSRSDAVRVRYYTGSIAKYAASYGIRAIVRGIRSPMDLQYEEGVQYGNQLLAGKYQLENVYLLPTPEYAQISSTLAREMISEHANRDTLLKILPEPVVDYVLSKKGAEPV